VQKGLVKIVSKCRENRIFFVLANYIFFYDFGTETKLLELFENISATVIFVIILLLYGPLVRIKKRLRKMFILGPF